MTWTPNKDRKRWIVLDVLSLSLFVISIDNTVLNLALPSISNDLGSSASELQWIVDAYILVFASLLLTMGAVGDRYGRKFVLQAGMLLFGTVSRWQQRIPLPPRCLLHAVSFSVRAGR